MIQLSAGGGVVSGSYSQSHCAIAGNPARVVKTNITWDSKSFNDYVDNHDK